MTGSMMLTLFLVPAHSDTVLYAFQLYMLRMHLTTEDTV